jgi:MFS family permease
VNTQISGILRRAEITVFCAYIAVVLAGLYFYGLVDDSPFIPLMNTNIELAAAWYAIQGAAMIALAAVVIGGLPIGLAVVRYSLAHNRRHLLLLAVPVAAIGVLLVAGALAFLALTANPPPPVAYPHIAAPLMTISFGALFIIAAIASTAAVCIAVSRSQVDEQTIRFPGITIIVQPYRFALLPAAIATLAMGLILAATVAWGLVARAQAPSVFGHNLIVVSWVGILAVMGISTLVAGVAVVRGYASSMAKRDQGVSAKSQS